MLIFRNICLHCLDELNKGDSMFWTCAAFTTNLCDGIFALFKCIANCTFSYWVVHSTTSRCMHSYSLDQEYTVHNTTEVHYLEPFSYFCNSLWILHWRNAISMHLQERWRIIWNAFRSGVYPKEILRRIQSKLSFSNSFLKMSTRRSRISPFLIPWFQFSSVQFHNHEPWDVGSGCYASTIETYN